MNIVQTMIQISFSSIDKHVLIIFAQLLSYFFNQNNFVAIFLNFLSSDKNVLVLSCTKVMNSLELNKTDMELLGQS